MDEYEVVYCKYCGRVKIGDRRVYTNPIKRIAEKYARRIDRHLPPGKRVKGYKIFKLGEEEGYKLYELVVFAEGLRERIEFKVRESLGVCPRCSRKLFGYYEALVQIRGPREKVEKAYEEVRERIEALDSYVRTEHVKEGINVYFLEHKPARDLAKTLSSRRGAKHILSRSLLKIEDGKRRGIETHSIRIPEADPRDLVSLNGRRYIFRGVHRGRFEVLRIPDLKLVAYPAKSEIKLIDKPREAIAIDADESVAMIYEGEKISYAEALGEISPGETVLLYRDGERLLAISKKKVEEKMKRGSS